MRPAICVITGANRGFGNALLYAALQEGLEIEALSRSPRSDEVPAECSFTQVDCSDSNKVMCFWNDFAERHGGTKEVLLVNNAGIYIKQAFHLISPADFDRTVAANLYCAFNMIRGFVHHYSVGTVVNIISTSALQQGVPRTNLALKSAYAASKAAEKFMTESIRQSVSNRSWKITNYFPRNINTWSSQPEKDSFDRREFALWIIRQALSESSLYVADCTVLPL